MSVIFIYEKDWQNLTNSINQILTIVQGLQKQGVIIMADLTALTNQVTENVNVEQSAITLIQNIAAQLQAAGTDPAKLAALTSQLNTSATALAQAITANTPVAPPAPAPAA